MDSDAVEDLRDEIDLSERADKAERFEALGSELAEGEYGRQTFLIAAAEHWQIRGEHEHALSLLDLIGPASDETLLSPDVARLASLFGLGRVSEAEGIVADQLAAFRRDELTVAECLEIGLQLAKNGRRSQALRWYTLPLTRLDRDLSGTLDLDDLGPIEQVCLISRFQLRRELERGLDDFDRMTLELDELDDELDDDGLA